VAIATRKRLVDAEELAFEVRMFESDDGPTQGGVTGIASGAELP
jgi:hypothetical protein